MDLPSARLGALDSAPALVELWQSWRGEFECGHTGRVWRPSELNALTDAIAARPAFRAVTAGTPVIVMLGNSVAFPISLMAILQRGGNPLLVSAGTPAAALTRLAEEFGARLAVHDFIEGISALDPSSHTILDRVAIGPMEIALLDTGSRAAPEVEVDAAGVILHPTSGTYGKARFCLRTQAIAAAEAASYLATFDFYGQIRVHFATPLSHGYGYGFGLLAALLSHSTLAVHSTFNPKRILRREREQPSRILGLVPPMVKALVAARIDGQHLAATTFYSGAATDPRIAADFEAAFATPLFTNWGTTETGPISTSYHPSGKLPGVGRPFQGVAVRATASAAYDGLGGDIGEIEVRSPLTMAGYVPGWDRVRQPEWFSTGDIGSIDGDGCIRLVGRARDIVNVGGSKVDPAEVESVILSFPSVDDTAVYPGHRHDGTEFVQAAIAGSGVDFRALREHCLRQLEGYKVPTIFHRVDAIPHTPSGKRIKVKCPDYPAGLLVRRSG